MTFGRILWCLASAFILYTPLPSLASDISHVGSVTSVGCAHEHLNVLDGTEVSSLFLNLKSNFVS